MSVAFASGKVILLGEHAVVYGHPALAGALASGVRVEAAPSDTPRLRVPAWAVDLARGDRSLPLGEAFTALLDALERMSLFPIPSLSLTARFELPTGAGLGSSAALSVALLRALAESAGCALGDEELCQAAMAAETVFHGRPSGIDHAVSARGGFGLFTRQEGLRPIRAASPVPLVIAHTGRERDTRGRVARVAALTDERPEETREHFRAIAALVERAAAAVERGDLDELGAAMNQNQRHLEALEVSCPEIERLCALARDAGARGAKLTGGGGGGCVIALAPGREPALQRAFTAAGFTSFVTTVGGVGGAAPGPDHDGHGEVARAVGSGEIPVGGSSLAAGR